MRIRNYLTIGVITAVLITAGCAGIKISAPLTIPGINTSNIQILENDEGRTAVLVGSVPRNVDKITVEDYVRTNYNYEKIVNHIRVD